jgi:TRAP-type C4-dicarboxylate transport system substrate-binding protein
MKTFQDRLNEKLKEAGLTINDLSESQYAELEDQIYEELEKEGGENIV